MIDGRNAIILDIDEAMIILNELMINRTREKIEDQQKRGVLTIIEEFRLKVAGSNGA